MSRHRPLSCRLPRILLVALITAVLFGLAVPGLDGQQGGFKVKSTLVGHTDPVYTVAFSPDGKYVATGSFDFQVKLWDAATGKVVKTYGGSGGHQKMVLAAAFSPGGHMLASGAADNTLRVWDVPMSSPLRSLPTPEAVMRVALSPDGSRLAVGGKDGIVRVLAAGDFKVLNIFPGHVGPVTGLTFSPNGQQLVSSGADRTVRFWDLKAGQPAGLIGAHGVPINALQIAPNGAAVYTTGDDGLLKFWQSPPPPTRYLAAPAEALNVVALSADGNQVLTGGANKNVRLFNYASGKETRTLPGAPAVIRSTAFNAQGNLAAVGGEDGMVVLWSTMDGKQLGVIPAHEGAVTAISFHPGNNQLLTGGKDGLLKRWRLPVAAEQAFPHLEAHAGGVVGAFYHPNGNAALSAGKDGTVKVWDLTKGEVVRTLGPVNELVQAVACTADHSFIGVAAGKTVHVWNAADGKLVATLAHPTAVTSLAFSADKTRLITGAEDRQSRLWEVATGRLLQFYPQSGTVRGVAYHPGNQAVLTADAGGKVAIDAIALQRAIAVSPGPVHTLALTANGSHVLTAGSDKLVTFWNAGSGAKERTLQGATQDLTALAVSKNGALVAAAGKDRTLRVYNAADGKELAAQPLPAPVSNLAFSPGGQLLAVTSERSVAAHSTEMAPGKPLPPGFLKVVQTFAHGDAATDVVIGPDNSTLYSAGLDRKLLVWKVAGAAPAIVLNHPAPVNAVAFHPTAPLLASGGQDGKVRIFDLTKKAAVREINAHAVQNATMIYGVAWSPDGKYLVSASYDNTAKLWDPANGNLVREFKTPPLRIPPVRVVRTVALAGSAQGTGPVLAPPALLAGLDRGAMIKGHEDSVHCVAFSPDGKLLATGSGGQERSIKIWNVADGTILHNLENPALKPLFPSGKRPSHPGWVLGVFFTPDGKHLISAGDGLLNKGYVAVWDLANGKLRHAEELPLGTFHAAALSPDARLLLIGAGTRGRATQDFNRAYLLSLPPAK